jgi:nitroreductase
MDFFQASEARYSHKGVFLPDPVPLACLERIAQAGADAPTGGNSQNVKFVILPDKNALQPLCGLTPHDGLRTAPAAIALLTGKQTGKYNFELEDYAAATQSMLLAVAALGYVSLWLDSPYFEEDQQKSALLVLGAPEGYHLRAVLPIGLPGEPGTRREKQPFHERVFYRKFGLGAENA